MSVSVRSGRVRGSLLGEAAVMAAAEVEDAGGASGSVPGVPDPAASPAVLPGGASR